MEPYISLITLGVSDLVRSTTFYKQGLGLPAKEEFEGVTFLNLRGTWLALYPREALAADAHISAAGSGFSGFTRAHNVKSKEAVDLRLQEMTTAQQVQALYDKQIDVGIVRSAISERGLSVECLLPESLVLALPENHPLSAQTQVSLSTLANEFFILFPAKLGPLFYEQIMHSCEQAGFRPKVAQEAVQMQTIIGLVAAGLGVAIVPASMQNFHRNGVIYRPLQEQISQTGLYLAWRQHDSSPALSVFLNLVRSFKP